MTIRLADAEILDSIKPCTHDYQVSCGNCRLSAICLPLALENDWVSAIADAPDAI